MDWAGRNTVLAVGATWLIYNHKKGLQCKSVDWAQGHAGSASEATIVIYLEEVSRLPAHAPCQEGCNLNVAPNPITSTRICRINSENAVLL